MYASESNSEGISLLNREFYSSQAPVENESDDITITLNKNLSKTLFEELSDIKQPSCENKVCTLAVASIDCQSIPYVGTNIDLCLIFTERGSIEQKQIMFGKASKIYNVLKQTQNPSCNPGTEDLFCLTRVENVNCRMKQKSVFSKKHTCSLSYKEIK